MIGLITLAIDVIAIAYFCDWFGKTDWLMGHTYGPASSLIAAMWTAIAGIIGTAIWIAIALFRRSQFSAEKQEKRSKWLVLQGVILVLLLLPTGIIVAMVVPDLPHARTQLRVQHITAGEASVADLAEALKSPDFGTRYWALQELVRMGPRAKSAVTALAEAVEDPNPVISTNAAKALAAIGPDAKPAIPALVGVIKREQGKSNMNGPSSLSWLAGKALTKIGLASIPELITLLAHKDRYVRLTAADALGNMGPQARDAVPALTQALNDEDELVRQWARVALDRIDNRRPVSQF